MASAFFQSNGRPWYSSESNYVDTLIKESASRQIGELRAQVQRIEERIEESKEHDNSDVHSRIDRLDQALVTCSVAHDDIAKLRDEVESIGDVQDMTARLQEVFALVQEVKNDTKAMREEMQLLRQLVSDISSPNAALSDELHRTSQLTVEIHQALHSQTVQLNPISRSASLADEHWIHTPT